jgi:hypothetical protein
LLLVKTKSLFFLPGTLEKDDYLNIDIGLNYKIHIAGLYPMYSDELNAFKEIGVEKFWHHPNYDNYNVNRKRVTNAAFISLEH